MVTGELAAIAAINTVIDCLSGNPSRIRTRLVLVSHSGVEAEMQCAEAAGSDFLAGHDCVGAISTVRL